MNQPLPRQGCSPALLWQPSAPADTSWWPCLPRALTRGSPAQGSLAPEAHREGIHCPGNSPAPEAHRLAGGQEGVGTARYYGGHGGPCARPAGRQYCRFGAQHKQGPGGSEL